MSNLTLQEYLNKHFKRNVITNHPFRKQTTEKAKRCLNTVHCNIHQLVEFTQVYEYMNFSGLILPVALWSWGRLSLQHK